MRIELEWEHKVKDQKRNGKWAVKKIIINRKKTSPKIIDSKTDIIVINRESHQHIEHKIVLCEEEDQHVNKFREMFQLSDEQ